MRTRHKGSALIIVLLLLVSMMLMGFALMRSVDIAGVIAGNVAIKQAASQAGDVALIQAETLLNTIGADPTTAVDGYATTRQDQDTSGLPCVKKESGSSSYECDTTPAATPPSTFFWIPATPVSVSNGLSYQYVIERMCDTNGNCLSGSSSSNDVANCSAAIGKPPCTGSSSPPTQYRVTAKISGPKNLTTYVQGFYSR